MRDATTSCRNSNKDAYKKRYDDKPEHSKKEKEEEKLSLTQFYTPIYLAF